ncbi:hypothetical protein ACS0TY_013497 [Phlomoides rotata]
MGGGSRKSKPIYFPPSKPICRYSYTIQIKLPNTALATLNTLSLSLSLFAASLFTICFGAVICTRD